MRVLVVEDDAVQAQVLARFLSGAGHVVDIAHDGPEGLTIAVSSPPDVVVLDRGLPGMDGVEVLKQIRQHGVTVPVLMLTGHARTDDRVSGLDAGADDYLAKPYHPTELAARLRALTRRPRSTPSTAVEVGGLTVDAETRTVEVDGNLVELTRREFDVVSLLARNSPRTVTRQVLMDQVFGFAADVTENALEAVVSSARRKLADRGVKAVRTVRGVGYRLVAPEPVEPAEPAEPAQGPGDGAAPTAP
jgi:DNA-binding response OmpR family regulator